MLNGTGEGSIDTMTDLIGNEEELNLLRQENQALREQADVLEETISLQREQIDLKDQLIAALQRETMLLTQQVQEIEDQLKKNSYGGPMSSSSVRFSRPPKSLRKKSSKKRG
jgi:chromosome segregation ATPase